MMRRLIIFLLLVTIGNPILSKEISRNSAFDTQIKEENTVYEIRYSFDLRGMTITIPKGCTLLFKRGGCLCNGTLKGKDVRIKLRKKCLSEVNIEGEIKSIASVVKSSSLKVWDGNSLASLCSLCPEGGKVVLDARFDYSQERTLTPDGSIIIDGKGKTVRTINPTSENFCPTFLDASGIGKLEIRNLKVDGGWKDKTLLGGTDPNRWFIRIQNVDNVIIKNCLFKDLKTSFGNWREVEDALMLIKDFHQVVFKNNEIFGCKAPEGPLFRHEPDDSNDIVLFENNKLDFVRVSSNVNIYFCKFKIANNYFGFCRGSGVNAFGHDGQIKGNTIKGSYNSAGIDISEYGDMNYSSMNIDVRNNKCGICYGGFLAGYNVSDILIEDNFYDAGLYSADAFSVYDTPQEKRMPTNDRMLYLGGNLSDIVIRNNIFCGGNSLLYQWDDAERNNIVVESNQVKVVADPIRSVLALSSVNGMTIANNAFFGTGSTLGSLGYPSFICSQPLPEGSAKTFGNVEISGNEFVITSSADSCYVFAHTIYDKRRYHGLAKIDGTISIHDNKCNRPASILINTGDFSSTTNNRIEVRNNYFRGGKVIGNLPGLVRERRNTTETNTLKRGGMVSLGSIVREGDDYYYVICGGVIAKSKKSQIKKDGLIYDGDAVLQKINNR